MLILTQEDVVSLLTIEKAIDAVENGYKERGIGTAHVPPRIGIDIKKHAGWWGVMPAYLEGTDTIAVKISTFYPENLKYGLPAVMGLMVLNDPKTGAPLAVIDGTSITTIRTGAAGGVAAKYLAKKDAKTAAVIGAGVQGRAQLMALCKVRNIVTARVYDAVEEKCQKYVNEMQKELHIKVISVKTPEEAVIGADVVITATPSKSPVFNGKYVEKGMHITAIGASTPKMRELDDMTIEKADKIVLDFWEDAVKAGDIYIPMTRGILKEDGIYAEIGDIIAGKKLGRTSDKEITIFKSVGTAVIDVSTAKQVYELARAKKIGIEIEI